MAAVEEVTLDMGVGMETEEGLAIIEAADRVTNVLEMAGSRVRFAGQRVAEIGSHGSVDCVDAFVGLRGWILFFNEIRNPNWAVSGTTLEEVIDAIPDPDLRQRVHTNLQDKGILKVGPPNATG